MDARADRPSYPILLACFFLSGATALIYEVVWFRMLGLILGHTVHAVTTVLVAFIGGLGLGSAIFGRRAARFRDAIRVYGILEIAIGLLCAATPGLMWLASFVYPSLHRLLVTSYAAFSFVQFAVAVAVLLIPTTLMGGTLPVLSQAFARRAQGVGRTVGTLYAVNTFGAVLGAVLAGYALLPALGNRGALWVAVAANLMVGVIAIAWSGRGAVSGADAAADALPPDGAFAHVPMPATSPDSGAWLTALALGVSGAVSMLYEVAWTRALTLVIGSSTFAFSAMLITFLLGIACGAAVYSVVWGRRRPRPTAFAAIQVGIAATTLVVALFFERLPELFLMAFAHSKAPAFVELLQVLLSGLVLLPSTVLIGATFPCAVAACAGLPSRAGKDVGWLYALNTAGAIGGATLAGFWLIPAVGIQGAIKIGILMNVAAGAGLLLIQWAGPMKRLITVGGAVVVAAGVLAVPRWDPSVMTSAPAIYGSYYLQSAEGFVEPLRKNEVVFYRDGPSATVAVTRLSEYLSLRVNGKVDASTAPPDMPNQLLSGHLPLLLHPNPRAVLMIGLGSGITAAAVARHPVERLDVVEIEKAVVDASRFFAEEQGDVLTDNRVRVIVADGRSFLATTPDRYDVIISEPSNPWIAGLAALFTVEYFELARQRLNSGGLMLQWLQAYNLEPDDVRMIVRTFQSVFPATSLWHSGGADLLLLGKADSAPIDLEVIKDHYARSAAVQRDLRRIGDPGWPSVLGHFLLGDSDTRRCVAAAGLNTDDRLALEFSAPRSLYLETEGQNLAWITGCRNTEFPEVKPETRAYLDQPDVRRWIGLAMLARGAKKDALRYLESTGVIADPPIDGTR